MDWVHREKVLSVVLAGKPPQRIPRNAADLYGSHFSGRRKRKRRDRKRAMDEWKLAGMKKITRS